MDGAFAPHGVRAGVAAPLARSWQAGRRADWIGLACALLLGPLALAAGARADVSSAYCKRALALADSRAALLYAPRVEVQGVRFPQNGAVDTGAMVGDGYQVRAALSFSPLDAYKGTRVIRVGEAECAQHEASRVIEEQTLRAAEYGRLPALRRAAAQLERQRATWLEIEQRVLKGLAAQVVSLLEVDQIRDRCVGLERYSAAVSGEIARLEALREPALPDRSMAALLEAAEAAVIEYEREASHLRSLDAWEFKVTGGAAPNGGSADFYGVAQLGFSLGAFSQRAAEKRALAARGEELRESRTELRDQVRIFQDVLSANRAEAKRAKEIMQRRVDVLREARAAIERANASRALAARALLDLELISAEVEQTFFHAWLDELDRAGVSELGN